MKGTRERSKQPLRAIAKLLFTSCLCSTVLGSGLTQPVSPVSWHQWPGHQNGGGATGEADAALAQAHRGVQLHTLHTLPGLQPPGGGGVLGPPHQRAVVAPQDSSLPWGRARGHWQDTDFLSSHPNSSRLLIQRPASRVQQVLAACGTQARPPHWTDGGAGVGRSRGHSVV